MTKISWWKPVTVLLLFYTVWMGFMGQVPHLPILNETVRNLYFHVPMWFGMVLIFTASVWYSIQYLRSGNLENDTKAGSFVEIGLIFGTLGMVTGSLWARYTWGEFWSNDPKQNASAVGMMIYLGYSILRGSISGEKERARIASVYSIFAFPILIALIFILPRLTDSLHPGNGGNPGFNPYDQAKHMRNVFYPAILGWTFLGFWMGDLLIRYKIVKQKSLLESV